MFQASAVTVSHLSFHPILATYHAPGDQKEPQQVPQFSLRESTENLTLNAAESVHILHPSVCMKLPVWIIRPHEVLSRSH